MDEKEQKFPGSAMHQLCDSRPGPPPALDLSGSSKRRRLNQVNSIVALLFLTKTQEDEVW